MHTFKITLQNIMLQDVHVHVTCMFLRLSINFQAEVVALLSVCFVRVLIASAFFHDVLKLCAFIAEFSEMMKATLGDSKT